MIDTRAIFHVFSRTKIGKKAKALRQKNNVLANLYGLSKPSMALCIDKSEVKRLFSDKHESTLFYLDVDGDKAKTPVLLDEVVKHPVSGEMQHLVFRRVDLKEEIETEVQIKLLGKCEVADATAVLVINAVKIKTIPTNIPESIEVDISHLSQVGESITSSQLKLPANVMLIVDEDTKDSPVVALQSTKVEEVVEEVVEAGAEAGTGEEAQAKPSTTIVSQDAVAAKSPKEPQTKAAETK